MFGRRIFSAILSAASAALYVLYYFLYASDASPAEHSDNASEDASLPQALLIFSCLTTACMSYGILFFWTLEVFPTATRAQGAAAAAFCGRLGAVFAPFVGHMPGALLAFGGMAAVAAAGCLWLPETKGRAVE